MQRRLIAAKSMTPSAEGSKKVEKADNRRAQTCTSCYSPLSRNTLCHPASAHVRSLQSNTLVDPSTAHTEAHPKAPMVLARVAEYLFPSNTISHYAPTETAAQGRLNQSTIVHQDSHMDEDDLDAARPPYIHVSLDDDTPTTIRVD